MTIKELTGQILDNATVPDFTAKDMKHIQDAVVQSLACQEVLAKAKAAYKNVFERCTCGECIGVLLTAVLIDGIALGLRAKKED